MSENLMRQTNPLNSIGRRALHMSAGAVLVWRWKVRRLTNSSDFGEKLLLVDPKVMSLKKL